MTLVAHCLICGRNDPHGNRQALCMKYGSCQYLGKEGNGDADAAAAKFFGQKKND